jgi:hypothetical protein
MQKRKQQKKKKKTYVKLAIATERPTKERSKRPSKLVEKEWTKQIWMWSCGVVDLPATTQPRSFSGSRGWLIADDSSTKSFRWPDFRLVKMRLF